MHRFIELLEEMGKKGFVLDVSDFGNFVFQDAMNYGFNEQRFKTIEEAEDFIRD